MKSLKWTPENLSEKLAEELHLMTPNRIKTIRNIFGLTQESFADLCGISYHTYRNWEIGHRRPCGSGVALLILAEKNPKLFFKKSKAGFNGNYIKFIKSA